MLLYDENGHFCVDKDYNTDAAGYAEADDAKADDDSYNWWVGNIYII